MSTDKQKLDQIMDQLKDVEASADTWYWVKKYIESKELRARCREAAAPCPGAPGA